MNAQVEPTAAQTIAILRFRSPRGTFANREIRRSDFPLILEEIDITSDITNALTNALTTQDGGDSAKARLEFNARSDTERASRSWLIDDLQDALQR